MGVLDSARILLNYLRAPRRTGAVWPSSKYLARKMADAVGDFASDGSVVVELGSGTGAITEWLVKKGCAKNSKLFCIEFDSGMCALLSKKFPDAQICNGSAENIRALVGIDNAPSIRAIVSGLPLLSLPEAVVKNILEEVEATLPKGGKFVQFTYNLKRDPSVLGFKTMKPLTSCRVYRNIPPARVDVFEKI